MKKLVLLLLIGSSVLFAGDFQVVNNTKHKVKVQLDVKHGRNMQLTLKKYSHRKINVTGKFTIYVEVIVDLDGKTDRYLTVHNINPIIYNVVINTVNEDDKAYEIDKERR